jgi:hypothetical protein
MQDCNEVLKESSSYDEVPIYFSLKEQLVTTIHKHVELKYTAIAVQHVADIHHYLLKHRLNPPNRRALLFNVSMTLIGYVHGQDEHTIMLAYNVMEFIKDAKQRQTKGSNLTISQGTRAIRRDSKTIRN